jgi:hypothetical protein
MEEVVDSGATVLGIITIYARIVVGSVGQLFLGSPSF